MNKTGLGLFAGAHRAAAFALVVAAAGCGTGTGSGSDAAVGADAAGDAASSETVRSCVVLGDTCSEFHNVPAGDVATICSSAAVTEGPCSRTDLVGGCRKDYTVGYYIVWGYSTGGVMTEASVRSFCSMESPPGTFVAP